MARSVRYLSDSVIGTGVATAPNAADAIAAIPAANLPKGSYEVMCHAGVSGTAVGDLGNMELQIEGVDEATPIPSGASGQMAPFVIPRITLDGTQGLTIEAIGAGTASIEYAAMIVATKIEPL